MNQGNTELKETRQAKDSQSLCFVLPEESILAAKHLLIAFLKIGFVPIDCIVLCTQTVSRSGLHPKGRGDGSRGWSLE